MHRNNLNKTDRLIRAKLKGKRGHIPAMPEIGAIVAPRKNPGKSAFKAQRKRYNTFAYGPVIVDYDWATYDARLEDA